MNFRIRNTITIKYKNSLFFLNLYGYQKFTLSKIAKKKKKSFLGNYTHEPRAKSFFFIFPTTALFCFFCFLVRRILISLFG